MVQMPTACCLVMAAVASAALTWSPVRSLGGPSCPTFPTSDAYGAGALVTGGAYGREQCPRRRRLIIGQTSLIFVLT